MRQLAFVVAFLAPALAAAQQIEVPVLVLDAREAESGPVDTDLDLANLVQTAAKGLTTVQEAPAIITILPADELADRNTRNLEEAVDRIPGWLRYTFKHNQFASLNPRGTHQAVLVLRDGISMFDPGLNLPSVSRTVPLETVKRIEVVTGPGGVLWGANSFLGVINVISKDAEDIDGVEASAGYGDGPGDKQVFRGYAMTGLTDLPLDAKLFAHVSFESFIGPIFEMPQLLLKSPTPQPNSPNIYGPMTKSDPARSMIFNFDGKLTLGPLNLYWSVPFALRYYSLTFSGAVVRENLPEDDLPGCTPLDRNDPLVGNFDDDCIDRGRAFRKNRIDNLERYAAAELKTRFSQKAGLNFKGYFVQFVRAFEPLAILGPLPDTLEGGIALQTNITTYRGGATIDGDVELPGRFRLSYGAETFHEWLPDRTSESRQGAGSEGRFYAPYDTNRLPFVCPFAAQWDGANPVNATLIQDCPVTFAFEADRTVFGAFSTLQWRPSSRLVIDGGVRFQVAPASLGSVSYDPVVLGSGALVYRLAKNWHAKLNVTQGFRPPVFNNTNSNGEAVQIAGDPALEVETSTAYQAEINARLLKGRKQIRELTFRADYSYTILDNYIGTVNGQYANTARRGMSSAEAFAKLYLKGDHRLELGYTWLRIDASDLGRIKGVPEHWFNVGGVVSVVRDKLELNGNVRVLGAFEDPNIRADVRGLAYDPVTGQAAISDPMQSTIVQTTELTLDRVPPSAELQLGVRWQVMKGVMLAATASNVFNSRHYQPETFYEFEPRNEFLPNPYEDFRFFASLTFAR
jgi:outer membrane receptor protein involved in Fe transport